jgi:hypothetical protein
VNLSDDVFARICRALDLSPVAASAEEAEPMEVSARVEFEPPDSSAKRPGTLCELSASGAALVVERPLGAGETVVLHLPVSDGGTVPVACRVDYARLAGGGSFRVAVHFISFAEADAETHALTSVVAHGESAEHAPVHGGGWADRGAAATGDAERRRGRARRWGPAVLHTTDGSGEPVTENVELADVSPGGVGFVCQRSLDVDQRIAVRFRDDKGREVLRHCKVVHCRQIDNGYRIGAASGTGGLSKLKSWFS